MSQLLRNTLCIATLLLTGQAGAASGYSFNLLETPVGFSSYAYDINNQGQIVGNITDGGISQATLWSSGKATNLGTLGGGYGVAYGINSRGTAVGIDAEFIANYSRTAARYASGTVTDLAPQNPGISEARGINDHGQIVGYWAGSNFVGPALYTGGSVVSLGGGQGAAAFSINNTGQAVGYIGGSLALRWSFTTNDDGSVANVAMTYLLSPGGGGGTEAYAINDAGVAVGIAAMTNGQWHAAQWSATGTLTDLGTLANGTYASAWDINVAGQVVGSGDNGGGCGECAALWENGVAIDLNTFLDAATRESGWYLRKAYAVNDAGVIVGSANNWFTGQAEAFVLTPVPEPHSYALMMLGLGVVGTVVRCRQRNTI